MADGPIIDGTVTGHTETWEPLPDGETSEYADFLVTDLLDGVPQGTRIERKWKPGTSEANRDALVDKASQAADYFKDKYQSWDQLTNVQKDAAMKQAMRALSNLCQLAANRLDDGGV